LVEASILKDVLKRYREGKLAHAFLLETNDSNKCYKDVVELLKSFNCLYDYTDNCDKDCNVCRLIDSESLPSLITIVPEGQNIKKDQILSMMDKFSTKPVFTKYNMYVIREADRFNSSSANTLLKFLEEPEDNILGFFITNNKENVISTIRSRCQVFSCNYDTDIMQSLDEEILTDVKLYLNAIYKNKNDILYNKTHMSGYYKERIEWEKFFNTMLYYLKDCYTSNRIDKIEMVKEVSKENLIKMVVEIETILK
jgi:DNA polymerase-3 subunit delta'